MYKPEFPHEINEQIKQYTNDKLPAFFKYAKDKEGEQVKSRNGSFVNKIYDKIPNKAINTAGMKLGKIDYKVMMSNPSITHSEEVSSLYDKLIKQYRHMINMKDEYVDNLRYVACSLRDEFSKFGYSEETICDMLVEYLYKGKKRYKQLLWFCYGQYIVNNLEKQFGKRTKFIQCVDCDEWVEVDIDNHRTFRCPSCQRQKQLEYQRKSMQKSRN